MKKRLFALLLALCMMFIAAACSNQESDADDSDQNQTEEASVEKTADENSEYETVESMKHPMLIRCQSRKREKRSQL